MIELKIDDHPIVYYPDTVMVRSGYIEAESLCFDTHYAKLKLRSKVELIDEGKTIFVGMIYSIVSRINGSVMLYEVEAKHDL